MTSQFTHSHQIKLLCLTIAYFMYLYNLDVGPWIRLTVGFSPWVSSGDDGTRWMLSRHPLPRPMWDHKIPGGEKEGEGRLIECGEPKGWICRVIGWDHSTYNPACVGWSGRTTPCTCLDWTDTTIQWPNSWTKPMEFWTRLGKGELP